MRWGCPVGPPGAGGEGVVGELDRLAVDETVILLHPPLHLVSVSIVMERERQQNDRTLVNG